ncbi:MAG TPA: T9SS type A sorting domain-containing protein [Bacteroidales bacterium]|nr:T9SS type A sorting domain-containing protein [Bacteroidales bacterium]HSA44888.1 T9SS type A sorting domain-containing protein [Bacteroidales bacterium]
MKHLINYLRYGCILAICLLPGLSYDSPAQNVNGVVLTDSLNLKVIRVWGTHQERGYACGYILAGELEQMLNYYVKPIFGSSYATARNLVNAGNDLQIDQAYYTEAQGMVDGLTAATGNPASLDVLDVLVGNCLLDLMSLMGMKCNMGCSSLLNWGDATLGTPLNGKAVISRHLDWQINSTLVNNQVMVVHQPSEPGKQHFALIGFAGMMAALSGVNAQLGVFQHVMDDYSGNGQHNQLYKPVWFALRDALENADYNGDGNCNVMDLKASLDDSPNGFAGAWIISALAAAQANDSLTAMIAEITPSPPTHTFRYQTYPDSIPGDNLYTANYQIARNNAMHFCTRYNAIRSHLGNGTLIGLNENWNLMRDWSHLSHNIQFMQFAPEANHLKIAVRTNQPAYQSDAVTFNLGDLLNQSTGFSFNESGNTFAIWPNPCRDYLWLSQRKGPAEIRSVKMLDTLGKVIFAEGRKKKNPDRIPVLSLPSGLYLLIIETGQGIEKYRVVRE